MTLLIQINFGGNICKAKHLYEFQIGHRVMKMRLSKVLPTTGSLRISSEEKNKNNLQVTQKMFTCKWVLLQFFEYVFLQVG